MSIRVGSFQWRKKEGHRRTVTQFVERSKSPKHIRLFDCRETEQEKKPLQGRDQIRNKYEEPLCREGKCERGFTYPVELGYAI